MRNAFNSLTINPLGAAPEEEMKAAVLRSAKLQVEANNGRLAKLVDKDRRAELVLYKETPRQIAFDSFRHFISFGTYTHRETRSPDVMARVDSYRRVEHELNLLDQVTTHGTRPEVVYDASQLQHSIMVIRDEMAAIESRPLQQRATLTLEKFNHLTEDPALKGESLVAVAAIRSVRRPSSAGKPSEEVALDPKVVRTGLTQPRRASADGLE
jgi:hypothetical protein